MHASAGGGGGGSWGLRHDPATVLAAADKLRAAAQKLDSATKAPAVGGTGEAAALLAIILGDTQEAAARVGSDAMIVSENVRTANGFVVEVDQAVADGLSGRGR